MQDKGTLRNLKNSPGCRLSASQYRNIALVHFTIFGGIRVDMPGIIYLVQQTDLLSGSVRVWNRCKNSSIVLK